MRYPGIEPGPHRWQRRILTTELIALQIMIVEREPDQILDPRSDPQISESEISLDLDQLSPTGFEPAISRFVVSRLIHWATETASHDHQHQITSRVHSDLAGVVMMESSCGVKCQIRSTFRFRSRWSCDWIPWNDQTEDSRSRAQISDRQLSDHNPPYTVPTDPRSDALTTRPC